MEGCPPAIHKGRQNVAEESRGYNHTDWVQPITIQSYEGECHLPSGSIAQR